MLTDSSPPITNEVRMLPKFNKPTVLELFAGGGGLALGFSRAGFACTALVEWNIAACQTLRNNFPCAAILQTDVRQLDFSAYRGCDVVAGGPPCQPFSIAGKSAASADPRDMFPHAIRAVAQIQPRAFLFENVPGLMRPAFSQYLNYILLRLQYPNIEMTGDVDADTVRLQTAKAETQPTYDVQFRLLDAADFGVPQHRRRLIIVGVAHGQKAYTWPTTRPQVNIATALSGLKSAPDHTPMTRIARSYPGHTGSRVDQPSKTIKATGGGGENMLVLPDGTVRHMTVHEAKLIQTFPSDYYFAGGDREAIRQIGNAVPVALAELLALNLRLVLNP